MKNRQAIYDQIQEKYAPKEFVCYIVTPYGLRLSRHDSVKKMKNIADHFVKVRISS